MIDRAKFDQVRVRPDDQGFKRRAMWILCSGIKTGCRTGVALRRALGDSPFLLYVSNDGKTILLEPQKAGTLNTIRINHNNSGNIPKEPLLSMLKEGKIPLPAYYEGEWDEKEKTFIFLLTASGLESDTISGQKSVAKPRRQSLADMLPTR